MEFVIITLLLILPYSVSVKELLRAMFDEDMDKSMTSPVGQPMDFSFVLLLLNHAREAELRL